MKTFLASILVIFSSSAMAFSIPLKGTCTYPVLDSNGSIISEKTVELTAQNPAQYYGMALKGTVDSHFVTVALIVGDYANIGAYESDKVFLTIESKVATSHQITKASAIVQGTPLEGSLHSQNKSISCIIEKK